MKFRWLLVALLSTALAVAPACGGGDEDNPFEGSWIAGTGERITFGGDTWQDSEGDSGTYSFDADDDRVYTLTLEGAASTFRRRATFIDEDTLELCALTADGNVGLCVILVHDDPTLH